MPSLLVLALVGLAAQMVYGSLGMAYGVTSSTLLVAAGITPAMASGSVHLAEVGTTLLSGASHWRFGNIDWKIVAKLGVPGAVGAFLGATALSNLSTEMARPWMATILIILGLTLLVHFSIGHIRSPMGQGGFRARFLAPLGLVAGFVGATGGGGWGPVATPSLLIPGRVELRKVIGSVSASEFLVSLAASVGFILNLGSEGVSWAIAGALLAGGAVAAPFAAWLVRKVAPRVLGAGVGGLIVLTNVRTLLNQFDVLGSGRTLAYLLLGNLWVVSCSMAVIRHRSEREEIPPQPLGV
ncbi:MAG TPA: sulfite exporter TauE/SafE family protein [Acidimicrobiia bacterium]|nr:sulfite exporter TauE/SafE family protein [Acidimicrobiia bacterium]